MAIGCPLIILKSGLAEWFKFWFMPWMVYYFWVAFLISHHYHVLKSSTSYHGWFITFGFWVMFLISHHYHVLKSSTSGFNLLMLGESG
jgi:hypothetical protein